MKLCRELPNWYLPILNFHACGKYNSSPIFLACGSSYYWNLADCKNNPVCSIWRNPFLCCSPFHSHIMLLYFISCQYFNLTSLVLPFFVGLNSNRKQIHMKMTTLISFLQNVKPKQALLTHKGRFDHSKKLHTLTIHSEGNMFKKRKKLTLDTERRELC